MKDLSSTVIAAAKNQMQQSNPFIRLVTVTLPTTPPSIARFAAFDRAVTFDSTSGGVPLVYQPFPVAIGDFRESKGGDLGQVALSIANVTLEVMQYIDGYEGLVGQQVEILTVYAGALTDAAAKLVFAGQIVNCEVDDTVAVFAIGQPKLVSQMCPSRRWLRDCSVEVFGNAECGYIIPAGATNIIGGGFDFCPRTLTACRERGDDEVARGLARKHPRRMDGAPGLAPGNV